MHGSVYFVLKIYVNILCMGVYVYVCMHVYICKYLMVFHMQRFSGFFSMCPLILQIEII